MAGARSAGRMPFMSASPLNRRSAALYGAELTQPGYQQRIAESLKRCTLAKELWRHRLKILAYFQWRSSNALLTVYRKDAGLKDLSDQPGPSGLMRGSDSTTGVTV